MYCCECVGFYSIIDTISNLAKKQKTLSLEKIEFKTIESQIAGIATLNVNLYLKFS